MGQGLNKVPALADFAGPWRLSRRIENCLGKGGHFEGLARFTPDGDALVYHEEGILHLGGAVVRATRGYRWRAGGGGIVVEHADGAPFHAFDPARPEAVHWCAPDRYRVIYDFSGWPQWTAVWTVNGPAKDYTMISRYARTEG